MDLNPILAMMERGDISLDLCSFLNNTRADISSLSFFKNKSSASDTQIFFLTILSKLRIPTALAMKMYIGWDEIPEKDRKEFIKNNKLSVNPLTRTIAEKLERVRYTLGLEYESAMYQYVTENIIFNGESINFLPFVAKATCSLAEISRKLRLSDLDIEEKEKLIPFLNDPLKVFPDLKLKMFVTGSLENKDNLIELHDLLEETSISLFEMNSIIIQLLHALLVMQNHKIMHNDIHFGNILVEKVHPPRMVFLNLGDSTTISFKTKYIPKIFDWDRSFCEAIGPNPILKSERYYKLNIHESFRKSQDYYHLICGFVNRESSKNDKSIFQILRGILPNPDFRYWYTEKEERNFDFFISPRRSQELKDFVSANNLITYNYQGRIFYNIPREAFEKFVISSDRIKAEFTREMLARYNVAENIYFSIKDNEGTIYKGFHCMPVYDVPDTLLYPLENLFSEPKLFANLTLFLKDFEIKEHSD